MAFYLALVILTVFGNEIDTTSHHSSRFSDIVSAHPIILTLIILATSLLVLLAAIKTFLWYTNSGEVQLLIKSNHMQNKETEALVKNTQHLHLVSIFN